jgi:plastocyanin
VPTRALLVLLILGLPCASHAAPRGKLTGTVSLLDPDGDAREDRGHVIVYLEAPRAPTAAAKRPVTEIRQQAKQFKPTFAVVVRGDAVSFPNDDSIFHNVFSLSEAARFDLGLYKSGSSKTLVFDKSGVIDVYCNIHPEMVAKIVVVDSPVYTLTDAAGRFTLEGIPPGRHGVIFVHPSGARARQELVVGTEAPTATTVELRERPKTRKHTRKDGSAYGRYQ